MLPSSAANQLLLKDSCAWIRFGIFKLPAKLQQSKFSRYLFA
jgi:hypothetical protein